MATRTKSRGAKGRSRTKKRPSKQPRQGLIAALRAMRDRVRQRLGRQTDDVWGLVILVIAALGYGALNYHFIRLDDGIKILKKTEMNLEYTFVDARGAKKFKLFLNPALLKAGIKDVLSDEGIEIKGVLNKK